MYDRKHLQDPYLLFERRTQLIRSRIQTLLVDYINVKCYISRAIIIDELERLVDDYIERQLVLQKGQQGRNSGSTQDSKGAAWVWYTDCERR